jgi:alkylhydroperoxidase/carboxymuconolactone decarboxylase family protein YurZ
MAKPDEHRARSQAMWREVVQAEPQREPLANHLPAALESGDVAPAELHEWVVHLAHDGGWPAGTTAYTVLREVLAARSR